MDQISSTTSVVPVVMPYVASQSARWKVDDRPLVIPPGETNFALLGQWTEIPEGVEFTVDYRCGVMRRLRPAGHQGSPGIYHANVHPRVALDIAKKAFA